MWVLSHADGLGGTPTWQMLTPGGGTPGARTGAGAGYNPATNRLVIFGGVNSADPCLFASNDVWVLDHANGLGGTPTWAIVPVSGLPPFPSQKGVVAYDNVLNRLIDLACYAA